MKRCSICDYLEGHGSLALGLPNDNRRLIWNKTHREYQCSDCYDQIKEIEVEFTLEDIANDASSDKVDPETPAVSEVLVK